MNNLGTILKDGHSENQLSFTYPPSEAGDSSQIIESVNVREPQEQLSYREANIGHSLPEPEVIRFLGEQSL